MERGYVQSTNLSELNRDNHEQWFRRIKLRLEGDDIFYTTEMLLNTFAVEGKLVEGCWNNEKKAQFKKDQAKLLSVLADHLSEEDQRLIDEFGTAVEVWARLRTKYRKTSTTAVNSCWKWRHGVLWTYGPSISSRFPTRSRVYLRGWSS